MAAYTRAVHNTVTGTNTRNNRAGGGSGGAPVSSCADASPAASRRPRRSLRKAAPKCRVSARNGCCRQATAPKPIAASTPPSGAGCNSARPRRAFRGRRPTAHPAQSVSSPPGGLPATPASGRTQTSGDCGRRFLMYRPSNSGFQFVPSSAESSQYYRTSAFGSGVKLRRSTIRRPDCAYSRSNRMAPSGNSRTNSIAPPWSVKYNWCHLPVLGLR